MPRDGLRFTLKDIDKVNAGFKKAVKEEGWETFESAKENGRDFAKSFVGEFLTSGKSVEEFVSDKMGEMMDEWDERLVQYGEPHSEGANVGADIVRKHIPICHYPDDLNLMEECDELARGIDTRVDGEETSGFEQGMTEVLERAARGRKK